LKIEKKEKINILLKIEKKVERYIIENRKES
jgi:hypothetical protein